MKSLRAFFESTAADRLMDHDISPPAIKEFLRQERELLDALRPHVDVLIEVGCMDGRNIDWAVANAKRYVGIDLARRHVEAGRRFVRERHLSPEQYLFVLGRAEQVHTLLRAHLPSAAGGRTLILFPFNVFGAVSDVIRVMTSVRNSRCQFLISAYQTTVDATACRYEYYKRCGYRELRVVRDERGVLFETADGFRTIAYDPEYLIALWRAQNVAVEARVWSQLNAAYAPASLFTRVSFGSPCRGSGELDGVTDTIGVSGSQGA